MTGHSERERQIRLKQAARRGFADGIASVFSIFGRGRPAPAYVRRGLGSLEDDMLALRGDCERLIDPGAFCGTRDNPSTSA